MPAVQNIAQQILLPHLADRPDKTALILGDRRLSYRQLGELAQRFANRLKANGIVPGERVVIALPDGFAWYIAFFGSLLVGVVPVLVNPSIAHSGGKYILQDAEAVLLLAPPGTPVAEAVSSQRLITIADDAAFESELAYYAPELAAYSPQNDDIALMMYTSGSTGEPKGVPHRHQDIAFTIDTFGKQVLQLTEDDIIFSTSKLFFAYGLGNSLTMPLAAGVSVVLLPDTPTPETVLGILEHHRPTVLFGVPTFYNLLLKTMRDASQFTSLRLCVSAGEGLPASIEAEWKALTGLDIVSGYGSTETLHILVANSEGARMPGSSGKVIPPFETRIVDDGGKMVAQGEPGRLQVRGASIAPFYWNRPEKTAETMLADGWLETGDIFTERDGWYFHQGRSNDLFKVAAQWVSPASVENALRTHPAVRECAVAGRAVADMLRPWAFVVPTQGIVQNGELLGELREHVSLQLPRHMVPVRFVFVEELPKTSTGKIQRFRL